MWLEVFLLLSIAIYLFYLWATVNNDFFVKRGIAHKKPVVMFGNMWELVLRRKSIIDLVVDLYSEHDGQ